MDGGLGTRAHHNVKVCASLRINIDAAQRELFAHVRALIPRSWDPANIHIQPACSCMNLLHNTRCGCMLKAWYFVASTYFAIFDCRSMCEPTAEKPISGAQVRSLCPDKAPRLPLWSRMASVNRSNVVNFAIFRAVS